METTNHNGMAGDKDSTGISAEQLLQVTGSDIVTVFN